MTFVMSDLQLLTPHMIITGAALVILLLEAFGSRESTSKTHLMVVGLLGIAGAAFTTPGVVGGSKMGFSNMLAGDAFAAFSYYVFYVVGGLTLLASPGYLQDEGQDHGEYYALVLLALVGMMLMAGATHLLVMFLALETMSIAIYALAGYLRTDRGVESSFKYFILGAFSSGFLLYGIALVYGAVGSTQLHAITAHFAAVQGLSSSPLALIGVGLVLLGIRLDVLGSDAWAVFWPLLLIGFGGWVLIGRRRSGGENGAGETFSALALLSARKVAVSSDTFQGGDVTAILGAVEVDLTGATPAENAEISVTVLMGGCDVIVPEGWKATITGTPILGGWDDTTSRDVVGPGSPEIKVRVLAILGGVEVRHPKRWGG